MTPADIWETYRSFTHEAARLETLQHYEVPGDEARQQAFRDGRPLPERPTKSASVELIIEAVSVGKQVGRVHIVELPLSDYVRYEFAAYAENIAAGEQVRIVDRSSHPDLDGLRRDFVLFDADTDHAKLIWYDYTPDGRLIGHNLGSRDDIAACRNQMALARRHSVPLAEFMSSCEGTR